MRKIIKAILLIICLCVFIFSAYNIYKYLVEENANKKYNNELMEKAITKTISSNDGLENSEDTLPIIIDFSVLKNENKDIVGWLYCKDTQINYPVVQGKDNEYYLHRLINGEYNSAGSIFMDYRNNSELEDNNTIIYGHNMKNKTMFGTLQEYKNQEYYNTHKNMYYFTPEKNYIIELFAGLTVSANSDIYDLSDIDESRLNELIQKSDFKSDIKLTPEEKIITLSTCAYEYDGARYIIIGVLREV